jgi:four helix bundle protein
MSFSHEKLNVYQRSLEFIEFVNKNINFGKSRVNVIDQLDRASTSITLNIAEGTGKFTGRDKCRYYDIARGSAVESAACLDILARKKMITENSKEEGKAILQEIVSMLFGLIKSSSNRAYENEVDYNSSKDN